MAAATSPNDAERARNESAIVSKLVSAEQYAEALPHALHAFELERSDQRCNQVGFVYELLQHPEVAMYYYRRTQWAGAAADPRSYKIAREKVAELDPQLVSVELLRAGSGSSSSADADRVHVSVDGFAHPDAVLPALVFMTPGKHQLTVRGSDASDAPETIEVTGEAGRSPKVELRPLQRRSPFGVLARVDVDPKLRGAGWAVAGTFNLLPPVDVAIGAFAWPANGERIFGGSLHGTLSWPLSNAIALTLTAGALLYFPRDSAPRGGAREAFGVAYVLNANSGPRVSVIAEAALYELPRGPFAEGDVFFVPSLGAKLRF